MNNGNREKSELNNDALEKIAGGGSVADPVYLSGYSDEYLNYISLRNCPYCAKEHKFQTIEFRGTGCYVCFSCCTGFVVLGG